VRRGLVRSINAPDGFIAAIRSIASVDVLALSSIASSSKPSGASS
jgi:hypothetical protein